MLGKQQRQRWLRLGLRCCLPPPPPRPPPSSRPNPRLKPALPCPQPGLSVCASARRASECWGPAGWTPLRDSLSPREVLESKQAPQVWSPVGAGGWLGAMRGSPGSGDDGAARSAGWRCPVSVPRSRRGSGAERRDAAGSGGEAGLVPLLWMPVNTMGRRSPRFLRPTTGSGGRVAAAALSRPPRLLRRGPFAVAATQARVPGRAPRSLPPPRRPLGPRGPARSGAAPPRARDGAGGGPQGGRAPSVHWRSFSPELLDSPPPRLLASPTLSFDT